MALNVEAYLAANPDVAAAVARGEMTAEQHYQKYGQYEGRDPGGATSGAQVNFWDNPQWQAANVPQNNRLENVPQNAGWGPGADKWWQQQNYMNDPRYRAQLEKTLADPANRQLAQIRNPTGVGIGEQRSDGAVWDGMRWIDPLNYNIAMDGSASLEFNRNAANNMRLDRVLNNTTLMYQHGAAGNEIVQSLDPIRGFVADGNPLWTPGGYFAYDGSVAAPGSNLAATNDLFGVGKGGGVAGGPTQVSEYDKRLTDPGWMPNKGLSATGTGQQFSFTWGPNGKMIITPTSGVGAGGGMAPGAGAQTPGRTPATGGSYGGGAGSGGGAGYGYPGPGGSSSGLSMVQQALLKALMDQAERDSITGEMRGNASELYDRAQGYEEDALRDIALYTGGNSGIYNRYGADIENDVGTAVADARVGQTQALNTAARQAMRYGINPAINLAGVSTTQASQLAAAANNTRNNAIANYRNLVGQGIGMKEGTFRTSQAATADSMGRAEAASMGNRNMRIQDESLDWAKQLDVTGLARGMPGASQGAYGVAVGAGNSAVQNQMAPGQALIGAMGQANNTTMQGRNLAMQGALGVLNAQTSYANAVGQSGDSLGSLLGGIGGLVSGLSKAGVFGPSDRRLKENIEAIGRDERTGLTIYEFSYIDDPDMRRYQGVMADEVIAVDPHAVSFDEHGFARVNYARLGIEFKEVV